MSSRVFSTNFALSISFLFILFFVTVTPFFDATFTVTTAHAQSTAFNIVVTPKAPGPFETVTISIEDYSKDLNQSNVTWTVNNKVAAKALGLKVFQVKTGALGTVTDVSINTGGDPHEIVLRPTATDLIWQADTYTPPFYAGKALHSNQDPITVVADPYFINVQGTRLDPAKLVYKWSLGGAVDGSASGYGKRTFRIVPSILLKPNDVSVEVTSTDGSYKSTASINVPDTKPEVLLYENHPLYGIIFSKALNDGTFRMSNSEISVIGEPFFFSNAQNNANLLSNEWTLNNNLVDQRTNVLTFRKPETGTGQSTLSLSVKNLERFMQFADASFNVQFSDQDSTQTSQTVF